MRRIACWGIALAVSLATLEFVAPPQNAEAGWRRARRSYGCHRGYGCHTRSNCYSGSCQTVYQAPVAHKTQYAPAPASGDIEAPPPPAPANGAVRDEANAPREGNAPAADRPTRSSPSSRPAGSPPPPPVPAPVQEKP
jgi:hypothetical protein